MSALRRIIFLIGMCFLVSPISAITVDPVTDVRWDEVDTDSVREPKFGWRVATNGDFAVVAAFEENDFRGQLYLFEFVADPVPDWLFVRALELPPAIGVVCRLGLSLAISDQWLVAGTRDCGAYLYRRDSGGAGNWGYHKHLLAEDTADRRIEGQGRAVAIDGQTIVVGAPGTDQAPFGDNLGVGGVLVYSQNLGGTDSWGLDALVDIPEVEKRELAAFGKQVTVSGTTLVAANQNFPSGGPANAGRAWVFDRLGGQWQFRAALSSDTPENGALFGESLDLEGSLLVVGSPTGAGSLTPMILGDGSVYTFQRDAGGVDTWGLVEETVPDIPIADFGAAVSLEGNLLMVGSPDNAAGGAWLFERRNEVWNQTQAIQRPMFKPWFDFGFSVDLVTRGSRTHALIGDPIFEQEESLEQFKPRFGKAFFYLYDDGLFSDGFEQ